MMCLCPDTKSVHANHLHTCSFHPNYPQFSFLFFGYTQTQNTQFYLKWKLTKNQNNFHSKLFERKQRTKNCNTTKIKIKTKIQTLHHVNTRKAVAKHNQI